MHGFVGGGEVKVSYNKGRGEEFSYDENISLTFGGEKMFESAGFREQETHYIMLQAYS